MWSFSRICLFVIVTSSSVFAGNWDIIEVEGNRYATAEQVAEFYKFKKIEITSTPERRSWVFRHPSLTMSWQAGEKAVYINKVKFILQHSVLAQDGQGLVHVLDLAQLIDPVLRPPFVKSKFEFDTVVINPCHGGSRLGAIGPKGYAKDYNLDIALRLKESLEKRGVQVLMTRADDSRVNHEERITVALGNEPSIYISIDFNFSDDPNVFGIETFTPYPDYCISSQDLALAVALHAHAKHDLKSNDLGIKVMRTNKFRKIRFSAIYMAGFLSNPAEANKIDDPNYRQRTADALAKAVNRFKSVSSKKEGPPKVMGAKTTPAKPL